MKPKQESAADAAMLALALAIAVGGKRGGGTTASGIVAQAFDLASNGSAHDPKRTAAVIAVLDSLVDAVNLIQPLEHDTDPAVIERIARNKRGAVAELKAMKKTIITAKDDDNPYDPTKDEELQAAHREQAAAAGFEVGDFADAHKHKCPKCSHVWEHDLDKISGIGPKLTAHNCPSCNFGPVTERYYAPGEKKPSPEDAGRRLLAGLMREVMH